MFLIASYSKPSLGDQRLIKINIFESFDFLNTLFSKNVLNFCLLIILAVLAVTLFSKKSLFPRNANVVLCPTSSKNLERTLIEIQM